MKKLFTEQRRSQEEIRKKTIIISIQGWKKGYNFQKFTLPSLFDEMKYEYDELKQRKRRHSWKF